MSDVRDLVRRAIEDHGDLELTLVEDVTTLTEAIVAKLRPRRGDEVEAWLVRQRNQHGPGSGHRAGVDRALDRYRECSDYGLTLKPEDDDKGDPS